MRLQTFFAASLGLVVAGALGACGSLDANTGTPPTLVTLQGSLSNPSPQSVDLSGGAVRIAVVWRTETPGAFNMAEDLPLQSAFPAVFKISFDAPPPAGAMNSGASLASGSNGGAQPVGAGSDGGTPPETEAGAGPAPTGGADLRRAFVTPSSTPSDLTFAYGTVVAYVDKNANGKLDLVSEGASAYVDQIVAANEEMVVIYLQGTIPASFADSSGRLPTEGYNLLDIPGCAEGFDSMPNPECAVVDPDAGACLPMRWLGMDTPYDLTISQSPEVADLMCLTQDDESSGASGGGMGPPPVSVQPASYPDPCSPHLSCTADGSEYFFSTCTTVSNGICKGTTETCTSVTYLRPTPTPAGWPCIP